MVCQITLRRIDQPKTYSNLILNASPATRYVWGRIVLGHISRTYFGRTGNPHCSRHRKELKHTQYANTAYFHKKASPQCRHPTGKQKTTTFLLTHSDDAQLIHQISLPLTAIICTNQYHVTYPNFCDTLMHFRHTGTLLPCHEYSILKIPNNEKRIVGV